MRAIWCKLLSYFFVVLLGEARERSGAQNHKLVSAMESTDHDDSIDMIYRLICERFGPIAGAGLMRTSNLGIYRHLYLVTYVFPGPSAQVTLCRVPE